jgi:oligoendopeptidase F
MTEKKLKKRSEINSEYQWNIESMYDSDDKWENDLNESVRLSGELGRFRGHLADSASSLADALEENDRMNQILERVFVYARMKLDEDNRVAKQQEMFGRVVHAISEIAAATSFLTPELTMIPEETVRAFLEEEPRLAVYRHVLEDAMRQKAHVLSDKEEALLAQFSEALETPNNVFTMLNDADMKFGTVRDENGEDIELTHGNYIKFMRSHDRRVRKDAYEACYHSYQKLINTIAANYSGSVKADCISARVRHYSSARNAALDSGNIPESVYDSLVHAVNRHLPALYDYVSCRKKILGYDELKMYDIYVPMIELPERTVEFDEAVEIAKKALAPLGEDYLRDFQHGIDSRWIDIYENEGKTSGAYSFGSYDSAPFVLMNYSRDLQDVFTLVHEMGHSMNSYYTRREQPFTYGDHSIFTAEVASTVNETLLMKYLLKTETDPEMRKYLLNMYLEEFRTTLFRQTMFAEFEDQVHRTVEEGGSLTAESMSELYDSLNTKYFGPALTHDDLIQYEWARIPHFYRDFYVYQYATGYSAANAIAGKILTEGAPARDAYLKFLASGSSDYPVELLKIAGVDMSSEEPVELALTTFDGLVREFTGLL